jgi:hypothetical protein
MECFLPHIAGFLPALDRVLWADARLPALFSELSARCGRCFALGRTKRACLPVAVLYSGSSEMDERIYVSLMQSRVFVDGDTSTELLGL